MFSFFHKERLCFLFSEQHATSLDEPNQKPAGKNLSAAPAAFEKQK